MLSITRHDGLISCLNKWQEIVLTQQALPLAQFLNPVHFVLARETYKIIYESPSPDGAGYNL